MIIMGRFAGPPSPNRTCWLYAVAPPCLTQNGSEISASQTEALFDSSCYCHSRGTAGNAVSVAEYPDAPCAIINLKDPLPQDGEGIYHPARNRDLPAMKTARVAIYRFYALARGAPCQQKHGQGQNGGNCEFRGKIRDFRHNSSN